MLEGCWILNTQITKGNNWLLILLESGFQQQKNDVRFGMRAKVLSAPFCATVYQYNLVIDRICRNAQELVWLIRFFSSDFTL